MTKKETKTIPVDEVGIKQGIYDKVELIPQTTKAKETFNEIVTALKDGKYYIMRLGFSRNSVYNLLKKLKEESQIEACFGQTKTATTKDGKDILQYVIFPKKNNIQ